MYFWKNKTIWRKFAKQIYITSIKRLALIKELVGSLSFGLKKRLFSPDFFKFISNNTGYY